MWATATTIPRRNGGTTSVTGYRPTTLQYPTTGTASSRVLTYSYGDSASDDAINRLGSIEDGSGTLDERDHERHAGRL